MFKRDIKLFIDDMLSAIEKIRKIITSQLPELEKTLVKMREEL